MVLTLCCEQQKASFIAGDADSIEAELQRLETLKSSLRSQGKPEEADKVHELWFCLKVHSDFLAGNKP